MSHLSSSLDADAPRAKRSREDDGLPCLPLDMLCHEIARYLSLRDLLCGLGACSRALAAACPLQVKRLSVPDEEYRYSAAHGQWPDKVVFTIPTAYWSRFARLTWLSLHQYSLPDGAFVSLLTDLTTLSLCQTDTVSDAILAQLPRLSSLDLCKTTGITDGGLARLTSLTHLDLTNVNAMSGRTLSRLPKLVHLGLPNDDYIRDEVVVASLTQLTSLDLTQNRNITDAALRRLTNLTRLKLCDNVLITEAAVLPLTQLRELWIVGATNISICIIAKGLPNLVWVDILHIPSLQRSTGLDWVLRAAALLGDTPERPPPYRDPTHHSPKWTLE
jgi:hypothetical protein